MVKEGFLAQFYGRSQNYTDIPNKWCKEYSAKKSLRNEDGTGVRIDPTRMTDVVGCEEVDGGIKTIPGWLFCRGVGVLDLVKRKKESRFGREGACFLLLFGYLPRKAELGKFCNMVRHCYTIPDNFVEMNLLRFPGKNLMNRLRNAVLTLYDYDDDPDNTDVYQTLIKGVNLLAKFPSIAYYAYQSRVYYYDRESLLIHYANPGYSIAKNFLSLLRKDQKFTSKEANLLDTILMSHADHGGGNDSAFINVVITSTGTGIYSTACGDIDSLRGPHHSGANIKTMETTDAMLAEIGGYDADDKKIRQSIEKLMAGKLCDRSGLIYGFGHAVCTVSDPCAEVLKACCMEVAREQEYTKELGFCARFGHTTREVMGEIKGETLPTNVDFYSGFAYGILRIPRDLYTPLLVCSRAVGWVARNIENKLYNGRIMRPATKYIDDNMDYVSVPER